MVTRDLTSRDHVLAMVKADAYGHGAVAVATTLEREGVDAFGVATVEEGVELKEGGITRPIVVMSGLVGEGARAAHAMVHAGLIPVVHSADVLKLLDEEGRKVGHPIDVHLKIDSGMNRLGIRPEAIPHFISVLSQCTHVRIKAVMTHLAKAADPEYTAFQESVLAGALAQLKGMLAPDVIVHQANSAAIVGRHLGIDGAGGRSVRPGLMLYGVNPVESLPGDMTLKPVMSLHSRIMLLKSVPPGSRVSYDGTFETNRRTRIAVLPIGYADGYPVAFSNKAHVIIRGKAAPVIGRVTMDMTMVDVTDIDGVVVGDSAVLMGVPSVMVTDWSQWADTIPYECLCRISKRVPRLYDNGEGVQGC